MNLSDRLDLIAEDIGASQAVIFEEAVTDARNLERRFAKVVNLYEEKVARTRHDHNEGRQHRRKVARWLRRTAQLTFLDGAWRTLNAFVVLQCGLAAIHYGLWGMLSRRGIQAYAVPADSSITISDFVYFTIITTTTVGYGDITPRLWYTQALASIQALMGLIFIVGIIGFLVSMLSSDEITEVRAAEWTQKKALEDYAAFAKNRKERLHKESKASQQMLDEILALMEMTDRVFDKHAAVFSKVEKAMQLGGTSGTDKHASNIRVLGSVSPLSKLGSPKDIVPHINF